MITGPGRLPHIDRGEADRKDDRVADRLPGMHSIRREDYVVTRLPQRDCLRGLTDVERDPQAAAN